MLIDSRRLSSFLSFSGVPFFFVFFQDQLHGLQQEHKSRLEAAQQQVDSLQEQLSTARRQLAEAEEKREAGDERVTAQAAPPRPQHRAVVRPLTFRSSASEQKTTPVGQPVSEWEEVGRCVPCCFCFFSSLWLLLIMLRCRAMLRTGVTMLLHLHL